MVDTHSKSLNQTIADGLSNLNVGDSVIVVAFLGYPYQKQEIAAVQRVTDKQIVVNGKRYWKSSGEQAGAGTSRIFLNDNSLVEWAILRKKAYSAVSSLERTVYDMQPEALKELLNVFEKHGLISPPTTLMEVMDESGLLDD